MLLHELVTFIMGSQHVQEQEVMQALFWVPLLPQPYCLSAILLNKAK